MKTLLLDLTSLDTPSRTRGSGRYVRDLALGISRLPTPETELRYLALTHLDYDGSYQVSEDLASFAGSPEIPMPQAKDHYHWAYARRLALFRAAKRVNADAGHLGDPHATPWFMGLTSCRRIVTCHDAIPMRFPKRYMGWRDGGPWLGTAIERRRYRSADLVVAISDTTLNDVVEIHRVPREKVVRVYNGVNVDYWKKSPALDSDSTLARFDLRAGHYAFYVGGYHWHKNVEGMLAGVAKARAQGADLVLVWAGRLSDDQQALIRRVAEDVGASEALRLIGYVSDEEVNVLYRSAVAHTLLSRYEGFGLTVVEAMASGCPVLTTRQGSLAEVAGDAGVSVNPEDHQSIAAALVRLMNDEDYRQGVIGRGCARASNFTLDAQAQAMDRVYRQFLELM
jgi:glycosyltransferase involved in cell wall biosynthesis